MFSYDIVFDETIIMQISTKVEAIILVNALNGAFNLGKNYS